MFSDASRHESAGGPERAAEQELSKYNLGLKQQQQFRLRAALTLTLSAPLNLTANDGRLDELLERLDSLDAANPELCAQLPETPYTRAALVQDFGVTQLCGEGWCLHSTFEPGIQILKNGADQIQVHTHHMPALYEGMLSNGTPGATAAWERVRDEQSARYDSGLAQLRDAAAAVAPTLTPLLAVSDLGTITAEELKLFCAQNPSQAQAFIERFSAKLKR